MRVRSIRQPTYQKDLIQRACLHELRVSRGFMWLILALNSIGKFSVPLSIKQSLIMPTVIPSTCAPVITFIVYAVLSEVKHSNSLSTTQAFTSLALLTLITNPAARLLTVIPQCVSAMGCFASLQKFLLLAPTNDQRKLEGHSTSFLLSHLSTGKRGIELTSMRRRAKGHAENMTAISLDGVTAFPAEGSSPAITDVSFTVEKGSLTALVGPTGSGESTVLKVILGKLPTDSGFITLSAARCGYCSQTPWLVYNSIRENVCGPLQDGHGVDEAWYTAALHACDLDQDIASFPDGDLSIVGSKGFNLSGGQRQRLVSLTVPKHLIC